MNNKDWKIPFTRPDVPQDLVRAGFSPLLCQVLALRGIKRATGIAPIVRKRTLAERNPSRLFQCVAECVFRGIGF